VKQNNVRKETGSLKDTVSFFVQVNVHLIKMGVLTSRILYNESTTYRKEWDHEANHEGETA
jgi:hypothetical protein